MMWLKIHLDWTLSVQNIQKNDRETSSDLQNSMQKTKELARQPALKKRG
jgi:hypothetical protein